MTKKASKYTGNSDVKLNVIDYLVYYYYRKSERNGLVSTWRIPDYILSISFFTFIYFYAAFVIIIMILIPKPTWLATILLFLITISILVPYNIIKKVYLKNQRINLIVPIIKRKPKEFRKKMMRNVSRYIIFIYSLFPASIIIGMLCVRLYYLW